MNWLPKSCCLLILAFVPARSDTTSTASAPAAATAPTPAAAANTPATHAAATTPAAPAAANTIAILDLKSTTVETSLLVPLANRLSSEIVKTGVYTVVERGEMVSILKEQGFQQSGCTDSNCAVQAGQLLNVRFIITGTVDKLGTIYSINVRMINVATSEIVRSISDDCVGCSIDDFVMKTVRRAALKLVGQDVADASDDKVSDALKVQHYLYKGNRTGKLGSITFTVKPIQSHVVLDDSGYGSGNVLIENAPAKKHYYEIEPEQKRFMTGYGAVRIAPGEIAEVNVALRKAYVNLGVGYSLAFFDGKYSIPADTFSVKIAQTGASTQITEKIQNSGSVPATVLTAWLGVETRWSYYSLISHTSIGNLFGVADAEDHHALRNTGNVTFNGDTLSYSTCVQSNFASYFSYIRKIVNFRNVLSVNAGLNVGFGMTQTIIDFYEFRQPGVAAVYNDNKDIISSSSNSGLGYSGGESPSFTLTNGNNDDSYFKLTQLDFGGPVVKLTAGPPWHYFFVNYMLALGLNTRKMDQIVQNSFALANEFEIGTVIRF